jgi:uncharacterized protein YqgC (DUF456 family)
MELTDLDTASTVLAGALILIGIAGVVVPGMPGLIVVWVGVLAWAILHHGGPAKWTILVLATFVALFGMVAKYLLPGRSMRQTGVPTRSLLAGGVLAIVGFFVVPVVGLFLGFPLGVFLAEWARLSQPGLAWPSTKSALKAVGLSMLIELFFALSVAAVWVLGLVLVQP